MEQFSDAELIQELKDRLAKKDSALQQLEDTTKELRQVNQKLSESESVKSHFISNITNELINPFTSILGLCKNIQQLTKDDWDKVQSMVKLIYYEAFNLDFQLKNIFTAAEIEAGESKLNNTRIDINSIINNVIESFAEHAERKKVSVRLNSTITTEPGKTYNFISDPQKLQLILANLLDNAIKYSSDTGEVIISVWQDGEKLMISVTDYGTGISEADKQTIYDRFNKGESGVRSSQRGHGLGLSIIKALSDLLGGSITFETQKYRGTTFTMALPEGKLNSTDEFSANGNDMFFERGEKY